MARIIRRVLACTIALGPLLATPGTAGADATEGVSAAAEHAALHGQLTYVEQETNSFHAPYRGRNSLSPDIGRETVDATLFIGARLWAGGEIWLSPEIDQGFGLDNTVGLAGFPSGAAYKVGSKRPYLRLPRAFVRATFNLGGVRDPVAAGQIQLAGTQSPQRVVLTLGKFSVTDVFDGSQYAHDPRSDFMNWTAVDAATFDYAADAWGYSVGAALEWYGRAWAVRAGLFDLSDVPNSSHLQSGGHQFQMILELERRYSLGNRAGRVLFTVYDSRARMARLDQAVQQAAASAEPVDPAVVRSFRSRTGASVAWDQAVSESMGVFVRVGGAGGNVEAYEFTDVDRSAALGLSVKGAPWGRARDVFGLAMICNRISVARARYLDAGGLGILVGDGRLPHAGDERIVEAYYELGVADGSHLTIDYQRVRNPAYNRDRGPVGVLGLRVHTQF